MQWLTTTQPTCIRHQLPAQNRTHSFPFVSGDTFRSLADYVFDETSAKEGWQGSHVKQGDIVFVKTDMLTEFFASRHVAIANPYILVSHNSDHSAPVDARYSIHLSRYLEDNRIMHWYAQNLIVEHPKATPIPIGAANPRWAHGNVSNLFHAAQSAPAWEERPTKLYYNARHTNAQRSTYEGVFVNTSWVQHVSKRKTYAEYLQDMAQSKFVIAPPGNGIDTHRAWEAIYLGTIPVVLSGPLDSLFEGLPVLVVDAYSDVTEALLDKYGLRIHQKCTAKAWAWFWRDVLEQSRAQKGV